MMKSKALKPIFALLIMGCMVTSFQTVANPITRQQAQQNALVFMQDRGKSISMSSLRHAPMRAAQPDEPQPYYVFNIGDNQGYVIASGDDCAYAVLGYSDEGSIDLNNLPCNLQAWLDGYAQQIQCLQEHGVTAPRAPRKTDNHPAIAPMLTTTWTMREYPYNMFCPVDPTTGERCPVGVEGVAMAQMMYYHRNRSIAQTAREIPAYTTYSLGIDVDAIPAGSLIDWNNMVDSYNNPTSEVQKEAVANLMRYCSAAVEQDYKCEGSVGRRGLSRVINALLNYFNYCPFMTEVVRNSGFSDEEWEQIIYNELANSRPVVYYGAGQETEVNGVWKYCLWEYFVCDGYDGNGLFHFNFGKSGYSDGYFALSVTDSDDSSLLFYQYGQMAVINAEPLPIFSSDDQGIGIHFADPYTGSLCLWYADDNGDGILTENEAAAVTDAGKLSFKSTPITSFDEFRYFTGIDSIKTGIFQGCAALTNITIPDNVVTIGDAAFMNCKSLTDVTIGKKVATLGSQSFQGCEGLKDLPVGENVTTIGSYAFYGCTGLTSITIPDNVTYIDEAAFSQCSGLTDVTINHDLVVDWPFLSDNLKKMTIGENVKSLEGSFIGGDLIVFNAINCSFGNNVFSRGRVKQVIIGDKVEVIPCGFMSGQTKLMSINIPNSVISIDSNAFSYCTGLTSITIPENVTTIGSSAFSGCSGLTSINIPNSVMTIDSSAFSGCSGLTSIDIPKSVTTIGSSAFRSCSSLKSVTISSMRTIGDLGASSFYGCPELKYVNCLCIIPIYQDNPFSYETYETATLRVPSEAVNAYKSTYPWNRFQHIVGLDPSSCDVNLDGEVNIADVNTTINCILGSGNLLDDYMSDVNCDGEVNIADINALIDKILGPQ